MIRRLFAVAICVCAFAVIGQSTAQAQQPAYGASWGQQGSRNMDRFYHYPYVTYPQNYWGNEYFRSADSLYHRLPPQKCEFQSTTSSGTTIIRHLDVTISVTTS